MHRDTKLGLAMAILVIGFAAALCFPRQDLKEQSDLPLETASSLDAEIALHDSKVYIPKPAEPTPVASEEVLPPDPIPTPVDAGEGVNSASLNADSPELTPVNPRSFPPERIERAPIPLPRESEPERVIPTRTYIVKPGDTLYGIAKEQMNVSTYGELLRANRERIADPNRLDTGLELIIPIPDGGSDLADEPTSERPQAVEAPRKVQAPSPEQNSNPPVPRSNPGTRAAGRFSSPRQI